MVTREVHLVLLKKDWLGHEVGGVVRTLTFGLTGLDDSHLRDRTVVVYELAWHWDFGVGVCHL